MKIGVIADVHGNAPALQAVLNEFDMRQDIEHIYCLGDMIGIGPDSNEVLAILFARNDVSMITGNHDEAVLALLKGGEYPVSHTHAKEHHQWIADHLDKRFITPLEQLSRIITVTIEGKSILFIHYHMEHAKRDEHISKDPFSEIVEPGLDHLISLFKGNEADLICFGHHHPIHFFEGKDTIFLNPGSLGCNSKPAAPYSVVELAKDNITVRLEAASYDNTKFLESYEVLQVPQRDFLMKAFHGNQCRGRREKS
ncbi:metallophosphoesterase family protein [Paenibacillus sp. MMS20-IR301]|uniref:metallophosphoesterase family protein n=1 Tax=Paenibacillus sp. MMS20-IR301 TaxID=2895946 RepID=UPI0028E1FE75|nr:metallophosphoesterase family protein [Paenibacillus sp. MMS20-IR301]WNS44731.1 metallophosphoesterase family protein [Paenibacillus sp. MMS20-IR301]